MIADGLTLIAGGGLSLRLPDDLRGPELPSTGIMGDLFEVESSPYAHGGIYEYTFGGWVLRNPQNQLLTYDIAGAVFGTPNPGEKVLMFSVPRSFKLLGDASTVIAVSLNAPDREHDFEVAVSRDGSLNSVGIIRFSAGATVGEFIANTSIFDVYRGDVLMVFSPFDIDPLFTDITFTISGYLSI